MVFAKDLTDSNTQGLMLLSQQRFDEAARTFRACLATLHDHLQSLAAEQKSLPPQDKTICYEAFPIEITKKNTCDTPSPLFSYDKGFMIVPTSQQGAEHSKTVDEHLFSCVFLYNLGLTFLLRGNLDLVSRRVDYKRSVALYTMSRNIYPGFQGCSLLLQLAILNNLAHIHLQNYDVEGFETCIELMREILCTNQDKDEEALSLFSLNVVLSDISHFFRLAPAA